MLREAFTQRIIIKPYTLERSWQHANVTERITRSRKNNKPDRQVCINRAGLGISMDFFETVATRRSVRKYKLEPISDDHLGKILETARLAPSAANRQPWRFVVVQDQHRKEQLASAANEQEFLKDAATIIVAVSDPDVSMKWHEKDTMIALEHIVLAATALGYGSCWIGAFDEILIKELLRIPERTKIVALVPIGKPDEKPSPKKRKDFHEIFYKEGWQIPLQLEQHHPVL